MSVYQRVYPIKIPLNHYKIPLNHYKSLSISIKSHQKWWFSIVMSVYQRVYPIKIPLNHYKIPLNHYKSLSISIKSHQIWWFSIVMSVYQAGYIPLIPFNHYKIPLNHYKSLSISICFRTPPDILGDDLWNRGLRSVGDVQWRISPWNTQMLGTALGLFVQYRITLW